MSEIKRYEAYGSDSELCEDAGGSWVWHEDHLADKAAAVAERDEEIAKQRSINAGSVASDGRLLALVSDLRTELATALNRAEQAERRLEALSEAVSIWPPTETHTNWAAWRRGKTSGGFTEAATIYELADALSKAKEKADVR